MVALFFSMGSVDAPPASPVVTCNRHATERAAPQTEEEAQVDAHKRILPPLCFFPLSLRSALFSLLFLLASCSSISAAAEAAVTPKRNPRLRHLECKSLSPVLPATALLTLPRWYTESFPVGAQYPSEWSPGAYMIQRTLVKGPVGDPTKEINETLGTPRFSFKGRYMEDRIVAESLFFGSRNGLIVEVGANDGYMMSSSYALEKYFDWKSVLIEGDPVLAADIPKHRPDALALNLLVCDDFRSMRFSPMGTQGGIVDHMTDAFLKDWHLRGTDDRASFIERQSIPLVECVPLGWVFEQLDIWKMDVLVVDLNGAELAALQSINFDFIVAQVVAVSVAAKNTAEYRDAITSYMLNYRYNPLTWPSRALSWFVKDPRKNLMLWFTRRDFAASTLSF